MNEPCTIAIVVWNRPDITAQCLRSLVSHTDYPHKVLIIDNGSEEKTKNFLQDFCRGRENFKIKRFDENAGYLKAANFVLETADTPYICLLNNDTILSDGWLGECISILGSGSDIGIVSPTTNEITVKFKRLFLSGGIKDYKGKSIEVNSGLGSCLILKKEAIDRIGYFDPAYGTGYFEEVDYCFKAGSAGLTSRLALGAYIEHLGNKSFSAAPEERKRLWHKNRDIFESRWGRSERILVFLKGRYCADILAGVRGILLEKCRKRAIVDLYSKGGTGWAEGVHLNIRGKKALFYNSLMLFLIVTAKKKAYDTVITDIHMPSLNGFYDFAGFEALDADRDPLGHAVHDSPDSLEVR